MSKSGGRAYLDRFLRANEPEEVPLEVFHWLQEAIDAMLNGADPKRTLGLSKPRHRPQGLGKVDSLAIAAFLEVERRKGTPHAKAIKAACQYFSRVDRTIRDAERRAKVNPDASTAGLERMAAAFRRPKRKLTR